MERLRESDRWAALFAQIEPPPDSQWIHIADREADFYEPIHRCQRRGLDFIIRGYRDRRLAESPDHLKDALEELVVRGTMEVELGSRPGQPARTAKVEVRSGPVRLQGSERPGGNKPDFALNVVEVRGLEATAGVEPLHWILLTSLACQRLSEVKRIIGRYTAGWWIEEYHKALKSGVGAEESQMEQAYGIETLVAVLAMVAVRLLNAKWLASSRGEEPVDVDV